MQNIRKGPSEDPFNLVPIARTVDWLDEGSTLLVLL